MGRELAKKTSDNKQFPESVAERFYFKQLGSTLLPGDICLEKKLWTGIFILYDQVPSWNPDFFYYGQREE